MHKFVVKNARFCANLHMAQYLRAPITNSQLNLHTQIAFKLPRRFFAAPGGNTGERISNKKNPFEENLSQNSSNKKGDSKSNTNAFD